MNCNLTLKQCEELPEIHIFWKPCFKSNGLRCQIWKYLKKDNQFERYITGNIYQGYVSKYLEEVNKNGVVLETLTEKQQKNILSLYPLMN